MPVLIQNLIFSFHGLKLSKARYNKHFFKILQDLKESEWWTEEKIANYQDEQVRKIVRHAYETVPFYRRFYDQYNVNIDKIKTVEDLALLPVLTKQIVRENQQQMVSMVYKKKNLKKVLTSGTTGTPLTIYFTKEGLAFQWAVWWRHKARFGISFKDEHLTFGARVPIDQDSNTPPFWRKDYFNKRVYLSTYHISGETVKSIVDYLNNTDFVFYTGYPSAMYSLASLIEEKKLHLENKPKYIISGSDALLPKYEAAIQRVFGAPVTDQYGMNEFAGNMSRCEQGKYHLDFECCYVEQQPLPAAREGDSKLFFTGWGNYAMPFIRYEVGDYGKPTLKKCSCGRHSLCFESIDGRMEDYIVTPDGRKIVGMNQVFEYAANAKEIQIYQKDVDLLTIFVVPDKNYGEDDNKALIRELRRRAGEEIKIEIKPVEEIKRAENGKFRAVISEVHE